MKAIRIGLLLLLVVLLPIRGAAAAAMLCSVAESGHQTELVVPHGGMTVMHHSMEATGGATDHASSHHGNAGVDHDPSAAHADKCNLCSAFCSLTPLASDAPMVAAPVHLADAVFPAMSVPAPSFVSGGQERPPRGI